MTKKEVTSWREHVKPVRNRFFPLTFMTEDYYVKVRPSDAREIIRAFDELTETIERRARYNLFVDYFADTVALWSNYFAVVAICVLIGYYAAKAFG